MIATLPGIDCDRRVARPKCLRPHPTGAELSWSQLDLWPPSVMRRVSLRRRTAYRMVDFRTGALVTHTVVDLVPVVRPTSADDSDTPRRKWTPPRHRRDFDALPYSEDLETRLFVAEHPDGASLEEIADVIGWTKQGVMEVERKAFAKLIRLARQHWWAAEWMSAVLGVDADDIEEMLCAKS